MFRYLPHAASGALLFGLIAAPSLAFANDASNAQQEVDQAANVIQQVKQTPHFDQWLAQSKGVFIIPDLSKGAFIVGGSGGQGVLLQHKSDGTWSQPAFEQLGSISVGAQIGGKSGPVVMVLMTNQALQDFQNNNFSFGPHAGLSIVNYNKQGEASAGRSDVILWTAQNGAFAGALLKGAHISQNEDLNRAFYGKQLNAQQILSGEAHSASAETLTQKLPT